MEKLYKITEIREKIFILKWYLISRNDYTVFIVHWLWDVKSGNSLWIGYFLK